jgi:hypothetical protein
LRQGGYDGGVGDLLVRPLRAGDSSGRNENERDIGQSNERDGRLSYLIRKSRAWADTRYRAPAHASDS